MPIDRKDGRHWCAPDSETPDGEGVWACPCGISWTMLTDSLWIRTDDKAAYFKSLQEIAKTTKESE